LPGLTTAGATLRATTQALGHHAERTGPAIDLRGCDDPLLWVPTTGSPTGKPPVRCSSRCASAGGLAIGDAANTWQRFVPIERAGTWQPVWPALDDLPSVVHEAGGRRGQVHRLVALVPGEVADQ